MDEWYENRKIRRCKGAGEVAGIAVFAVICDKRAALFALIALLQRAASDESKTSVPFMNSAFETFETEKESARDVHSKSEV